MLLDPWQVREPEVELPGVVFLSEFEDFFRSHSHILSPVLHKQL
jgi:hypothetical protein